MTGAGGKTGQAVLSALKHRGLPCVAWVRRPEQVEHALARGAVAARVVDFGQPQSFASALEGADGVYHICPNMHADEVSIAAGLMEAASLNGVERFVLHSVLHPQIEAMPHHWRKMRVEEKLLASGLPYALIQPSAYLQNLLPYWHSARERGFFELPYSIDAPISVVDLRDVATAVGEVLADSGTTFGTYELSGWARSHREVARVFSVALGRSVEARQIPTERWAESALASGLRQGQVDDLISMFDYYDRHGFVGNPKVLETLLGRQALGLEHYVEWLMG